jgi:hypothetical protein
MLIFHTWNPFPSNTSEEVLLLADVPRVPVALLPMVPVVLPAVRRTMQGDGHHHHEDDPAATTITASDGPAATTITATTTTAATAQALPNRVDGVVKKWGQGNVSVDAPEWRLIRITSRNLSSTSSSSTRKGVVGAMRDATPGIINSGPSDNITVLAKNGRFGCTVLVLYSYCTRTVLPLHSHCTPTVLLLYSYCTPTVFPLYCTPTVPPLYPLYPHYTSTVLR